MLQGHPYHPDNETIMVKMVLILLHSMNKDWEHFTMIRYEIDLSQWYTTTQQCTTKGKTQLSLISPLEDISFRTMVWWRHYILLALAIMLSVIYCKVLRFHIGTVHQLKVHCCEMDKMTRNHTEGWIFLWCPIPGLFFRAAQLVLLPHEDSSGNVGDLWLIVLFSQPSFHSQCPSNKQITVIPMNLILPFWDTFLRAKAISSSFGEPHHFNNKISSFLSPLNPNW